MALKYRVSLTELEITRLVKIAFEAKDYELYVLLKKQLNRIVGGAKTADYVLGAGAVRGTSSIVQNTGDRSYSGIDTMDNTDFTIHDTTVYIPGTTIKSEVKLKQQFFLMGHTRMTWQELAVLFLELGIDSTISEKDREFFGQLQAHAQHMSIFKGQELASLFDLNEQIMVEGFETMYVAEIARYKIDIVLEKGSNSADIGKAFTSMDTIPSSDDGILNKFGL